MSDPVRSALGELSRIRQLPFTLARTVAAEQLVHRLEADGPAEVLAFALHNLIETWIWGGEPAKAFLGLSKVTRLWDNSPELFDAGDREAYHWTLRRVVGQIFEFPDIPVERVEAGLADLEHRYALAGNGGSAVAYERFRWAKHQGSADTAARLDAWRTTPRDDFSQCEACYLREPADHFRRHGEPERAIALLESPPPIDEYCRTEPTGMQLVLALALLEVGRPSDALDAYRRAIGAFPKVAGIDEVCGLRFEFLARGGQPERAHRALLEDARRLHQGDTPYSRLTFLLPVVAGLSALAEPDRPVRLPGVPASDSGGLLAWVHRESAELAAAFDQRNWSSHYRELLAAARDAALFEPGLDFSMLEVRPPAAVSPAPAKPMAASELGERLQQADRSASKGDLREAAEQYLAAAELAEATGELIDAGFARAEAARCAEQFGDEAGALVAYAASLARLRAAELPARDRLQILQAWVPLAVRLGTAGAAVSELRAALAELHLAGGSQELGDSPTEAERSGSRAWATAADLLARALASTVESPHPDWDEAIQLATAAAKAYAGAGAITDASHAFWLAGRLSRDAGDLDAAQWNLESAVEGFKLSGRPNERAEAGSDLLAILRDTGQEAAADALLQALTQ